MTLPLACLLLLSTAPDIKVIVLPFDSSKADARLAAETADLAREVLASMQGVRCPSGADHLKAMRGKAGQVMRRCGDEPDCRHRIATLLGAHAFVIGRAEALGPSVLVELVVMDVGKRKQLGKISRALSGSRIRRAAALEWMFTEIFFPGRLVGTLELELDPPGGTVYLDGQKRLDDAEARVRLDKVRADQHTVRIERAGYNDFYAIVQVPFQGTASMQVKMRPLEPGQAAPAPPDAAPAPEATAWYERWWVWTIVGAVVVGATVTAVVLLQ